MTAKGLSASSTSSDLAQSASALQIAKQEAAHNLVGMEEAREKIQQQPLRVKAYLLNDTNAPANAKIVHFVRHGQGFHNLMADLAKARGDTWKQDTKDPNNPYIMPEIADAPLTHKGRQQAMLNQPKVKALSPQPQLVVLSPNCRALQTGLIVFESLIDKVPFLAHEMVREECGIHVCDQRRPTSHQAREFPQVDFSLLADENDQVYRDDARESKTNVAMRIYKFMEWLADRPESVLGVSTHSAWLLTVFHAVCDSQDESLKAWWQTGEMRSVKLAFGKRE